MTKRVKDFFMIAVLIVRDKSIDRKNVLLVERVNRSFDLVKSIGKQFEMKLLYTLKITYL